MLTVWTITVVDSRLQPWPPATSLVLLGVSLRQVAEYVGIRRRMSPLGLKLRYNGAEARN